MQWSGKPNWSQRTPLHHSFQLLPSGRCFNVPPTINHPLCNSPTEQHKMNTTVSWWLKHPCLVLFCMSVWMFMCLNVFVIGAMSKTIVCNPCVSDKYYYRILSSPNHRPLLWIPHHLFSFCAGISDMTRETHYDSTLKKLEQSLSPSAGQVGDYAG